MLKLEIAPKKPKVVNTLPPFTSNVKQWPYPSGGVARLSNAILRDNIIKKAFKECPFIKGQVVVPVNPNDFNKHGECYIQGIASSYVEYGSDVHWPENNVPMIITAVDQHGATLFTSTTFFKAK